MQVQVRPRIFERLASRPHLLDGGDPLFRKSVSVSVRALAFSKHVELRLIPADNDIERKTATADVVSCHHLLGGDKWVEHRRMNRAEDGDALCLRQQATGPGHC